MKNRIFQLWLRWSILLVLVHAAILFAIYGTNVPVAEKLLWSRGDKSLDDIWLKLPLVISRWFDLFILPLSIGAIIFLASELEGARRVGYKVLFGSISGILIGLLATFIGGLITGLIAGVCAGFFVSTLAGTFVYEEPNGMIRSFLIKPLVCLSVCLVIGMIFGLVTGLSVFLGMNLAFGAIWLFKKVCSLMIWRIFWNFMMVR